MKNTPYNKTIVISVDYQVLRRSVFLLATVDLIKPVLKYPEEVRTIK